MFYVYILKSLVCGKHYIGQTKDLIKRVEHHNSPRAKWTKRHQPWKLVHQEEYLTRSEAMRRESQIKAIGDVKGFLNSLESN
jgi:putative endonuclease